VFLCYLFIYSNDKSALFFKPGSLPMLDFLNEDIFEVDSDLIVIPIATSGSISSSFLKGLNNIGFSSLVYRKSYKLGDVNIIASEGLAKFKYVGFVCAVDDYSSSYAVIRDIGRNLGEKVRAYKDIKVIATPILGSGAGGLRHIESREILFNAFYETAENAAELQFCVPDTEVFKSFEGLTLDTDMLSAQLVLQAGRSKILSSEFIEPIAYAEDFYYKLAHLKFLEYFNFQAEKQFFSKLLAQFKTSRTTYRKFLEQMERSTEDYRFFVLCGELIAYIDYSAFNKRLWNKNPDMRVVAKSGVNQTNWLINLLRVKEASDIAAISATSIQNALYFLTMPAGNLTMLSTRHRELVYRNLMLDHYDGQRSLPRLFDFFKKAGFGAVKPDNDGALFSRILYLPEIKQMWFTDEEDDDSDLLTLADDVDLSLASSIIERCLERRHTRLDLGCCGLRDLLALPELFECTHLEELVLSNEWAVYKDDKWRRVTSENSGKRNVLATLPLELSKLTKLKSLVCGGDWKKENGEWTRWQIKNIRPLAELRGLMYLNLSNNLIEDASPLEGLKSLVRVHLNNNVIEKPLAMTKLKKLEEFNLSNNRITDVAFLKKATQLKTLDLHANRINDVSPLFAIISRIGIKNSKWEVNTINIAKNPLEFPPMEIINLGRLAVLSTITDVNTGTKFVNTDVKIILIGNSGVGKSTLVKYLDKESDLLKSHPSTHWMIEKEVESKFEVARVGQKCMLRLLDFGGHDYYHDTHHIFFTKNTLYLLLWEPDTDNLKLRSLMQADAAGQMTKAETQDYPLEYWLDAVWFYNKGVEADNLDFKVAKDDVFDTSLLMLQNKTANRNQIVQKNNKDLLAKYPFIFEFLNISIINPKRNMSHFDHIFQEMLDSAGIIGAVLPGYYGIVKAAIKNYTGKPVLTQSEFLNYCNTLLIEQISGAQSDILAQYLAQIGIVLCFKEQAGQKIYIRKNWVIETVHKVLEGLLVKRGEFSYNEMLASLAGEAHDAIMILDFMLDYHLIFKHPNRDLYIAPLYLPTMPATSIGLFLDQNRTPYRRFAYCGFIHKNVTLAFFSKYGQLIKDDPGGNNYFYWKDALIVKNPAQEIVMIKFDLGDASGNAYIDVFNLGYSNTETFIKEIIGYIKDINRGYDIEELVSMDNKIFVSTELLAENAKKGKLVFSELRMADRKLPKIKDEPLIKLQDYKKFLPDGIRKKRVVISYSKKDLAQIHELKRYLNPLVSKGLIEEPWYCTNFLPGDSWEEILKPKFDEADIVFFMVSANFYNTPYIVNYEIPNVLDRYKLNKSVKPIPIILDPYDWETKGEYNLQKFSALPYEAKPISDFSKPKMAWNTITISVQMMIEQEMDPGKKDLLDRELQTIYERQVAGKLDYNV